MMAMLRPRRFWIGMGMRLLDQWLKLRDLRLADLGRALTQARCMWCVPGIVLEVLAAAARGNRWQVLLSREGILEEVPWTEGIGCLPANILPLRVGESARVIVLSRCCHLPRVQLEASGAAGNVGGLAG
jgi:uncharacterized membrane protein YbhN (UPF0104 family)